MVFTAREEFPPVTSASDDADRSNCPPPDSPEMESMEVWVLLIAKENAFR